METCTVNTRHCFNFGAPVNMLLVMSQAVWGERLVFNIFMFPMLKLCEKASTMLSGQMLDVATTFNRRLLVKPRLTMPLLEMRKFENAQE